MWLLSSSLRPTVCLVSTFMFSLTFGRQLRPSVYHEQPITMCVGMAIQQTMLQLSLSSPAHSFCRGIHSAANCQADVNFLLQPLPLQPAVHFRSQSLSLSLSLIDIPFITDFVLCFIHSSLAHNTVESNAIDHQLQYAVSRALFSSLLQSPFAASPPI